MQRKVKYPVLTINNTIIERVKQFNFLGIILHYTLKWQKHIDYISKKISQAIGVMYRLNTYALISMLSELKKQRKLTL